MCERHERMRTAQWLEVSDRVCSCARVARYLDTTPPGVGTYLGTYLPTCLPR